LTRLQIQLTKGDPNRFCKACVKANSKRFPFPSSKSAPSTRVLHLLHTDIARPYGTPSLTGIRYILTVLDDYTNCHVLYVSKARTMCQMNSLPSARTSRINAQTTVDPQSSKPSAVTTVRSTSTLWSRTGGDPRALTCSLPHRTTPSQMGLLSECYSWRPQGLEGMQHQGLCNVTRR
jgi:hypothetical protein